MKKPNVIDQLKRWRTSQIELLRLVDTLRADNDRLRAKLNALQHAKDHAEKQAEERRREKETLRTQIASLKAASKSTQLIVDQLGAKITELREENDRLKSAKKK